ncbi:MAG: Integrase catalytic region [Myxococcaceae bacterium]|nr:Integrase catalytic region [Myxococcaceae bacterium]
MRRPEALRFTPRYLRRIYEAYAVAGEGGLTSKRRGLRSNRATPDEVRLQALTIVRALYPDFGPTFAQEKLVELPWARTVRRDAAPVDDRRRALVDSPRARPAASAATRSEMTTSGRPVFAELPNVAPRSSTTVDDLTFLSPGGPSRQTRGRGGRTSRARRRCERPCCRAGTSEVRARRPVNPRTACQRALDDGVKTSPSAPGTRAMLLSAPMAAASARVVGRTR